jgi:hypothetical protein
LREQSPPTPGKQLRPQVTIPANRLLQHPPVTPLRLHINWEDAITALDSRQLSCSPSEAAVLRIAASLGDHHIPAHLARVLGRLDRTNITLVTTAITRANG